MKVVWTLDKVRGSVDYKEYFLLSSFRNFSETEKWSNTIVERVGQVVSGYGSLNTLI